MIALDEIELGAFIHERDHEWWQRILVDSDLAQQIDAALTMLDGQTENRVLWAKEVGNFALARRAHNFLQTVRMARKAIRPTLHMHRTQLAVKARHEAIRQREKARVDSPEHTTRREWQAAAMAVGSILYDLGEDEVLKSIPVRGSTLHDFVLRYRAGQGRSQHD